MFKRAERKRVFLKIGLMGPSGSGKSYSAIQLARGLAQGGRIAALDTENGSLSLYSHLAEFDVCDIAAPFAPKQYIQAIKGAVDAGYSVLIVDSMTHAWKYILDYKESLDRSGGNSFTNWGKAKPLFDELKDYLNQAPIHIIACMRAKDEYILQQNGKGKEAPVKVGMGAILEPGSEYEYTTVFGIGMDHKAMPSKDRTAIFSDEAFRISPETGQRFVDWLSSGAEPTPVPKLAPDAKQIILNWGLSEDDNQGMIDRCKAKGLRRLDVVTKLAIDDPERVRTPEAFEAYIAAIGTDHQAEPVSEYTPDPPAADEVATATPEPPAKPKQSKPKDTATDVAEPEQKELAHA